MSVRPWLACVTRGHSIFFIPNLHFVGRRPSARQVDAPAIRGSYELVIIMAP